MPYATGGQVDHKGGPKHVVALEIGRDVERMADTIVDGKKGHRGNEHGVAHGARCCGSHEDAIEQEGGKAADGNDKYPEKIGPGGFNNLFFVAEDAQ